MSDAQSLTKKSGISFADIERLLKGRDIQFKVTEPTKQPAGFIERTVTVYHNYRTIIERFFVPQGYTTIGYAEYKAELGDGARLVIETTYLKYVRSGDEDTGLL